MPLNLQSFERRTGYIPVPLYTPGATDLVLLGWSAKRPDGSEYARYLHKDSQAALEGLAELVFQMHRAVVLERSGGRCEKCNERKPLHVHHNVFRSHGRDDRVSNLTAIDAGCHEKEHKKRSERPASDTAVAHA